MIYSRIYKAAADVKFDNRSLDVYYVCHGHFDSIGYCAVESVSIFKIYGNVSSVCILPCKFFYMFRFDKAGSKIVPAERVLIIEAEQRIEFGILGINTQLFDRVAFERFSRNKSYTVNPDSGNAFGNTYCYVFDKRV